MKHVVITISRQYGSGGRIVAQRLAEELGIPCYDKELIKKVAEETGLTASYIRQTQSRPKVSYLFDLCNMAQSMPLPDQVFVAQCKVIKEKAAEGPCVIVGRCADYVLDENPCCLRVFVSAPIEERIRRAEELYHEQDEKMESAVIREDRYRSSYYSHFSGKKWGERENYDLCIDTRIGIDTAVAIIKEAALALDREEP